jgi:hypothetical protein
LKWSITHCGRKGNTCSLAFFPVFLNTISTRWLEDFLAIPVMGIGVFPEHRGRPGSMPREAAARTAPAGRINLAFVPVSDVAALILLTFPHRTGAAFSTDREQQPDPVLLPGLHTSHTLTGQENAGTPGTRAVGCRGSGAARAPSVVVPPRSSGDAGRGARTPGADRVPLSSARTG